MLAMNWAVTGDAVAVKLDTNAMSALAYLNVMARPVAFSELVKAMSVDAGNHSMRRPVAVKLETRPISALAERISNFVAVATRFDTRAMTPVEPPINFDAVAWADDVRPMFTDPVIIFVMA